MHLLYTRLAIRYLNCKIMIPYMLNKIEWPHFIDYFDLMLSYYVHNLLLYHCLTIPWKGTYIFFCIYFIVIYFIFIYFIVEVCLEVYHLQRCENIIIIIINEAPHFMWIRFLINKCIRFKALLSVIYFTHLLG